MIGDRSIHPSQIAVTSSRDIHIGKLTTKWYECGRCGGRYKVSTNHWGRIYRGCHHHYYGAISECVEAEERLKELAHGGA